LPEGGKNVLLRDFPPSFPIKPLNFFFFFPPLERGGRESPASFFGWRSPPSVRGSSFFFFFPRARQQFPPPPCPRLPRTARRILSFFSFPPSPFIVARRLSFFSFSGRKKENREGCPSLFFPPSCTASNPFRLHPDIEIVNSPSSFPSFFFSSQAHWSNVSFLFLGSCPGAE